MKKFKKSLALIVTALMLVVLAACGGGGNQQSSSEPKESDSSKPAESSFPERDFEFVVPYGAGGGSDTNARFITKVIQDNKLVDKNILVVNKPGGSSAVGNSYTYSKKGDAYTISTWVPGQMTNKLTNGAEVGLAEVTPITVLALDSFVLLVDKESPYQTFEDFVAAVKANPGEISIGGTGKGGDDHLVYYMMEKALGTPMKFVVFQGGGEVLSGLMGGHIDAAFSNPSEVLSQIEAGELRAIAATAKEPLAAPFDQVPTFASLGHEDIYFQQFRGIVGPPEMPEEAIAYWEDVFKKVHESDAWQQEYIAKNSLSPAYMTAAEAKAFMEERLVTYETLLTELGMITK